MKINELKNNCLSVRKKEKLFEILKKDPIFTAKFRGNGPTIIELNFQNIEINNVKILFNEKEFVDGSYGIQINDKKILIHHELILSDLKEFIATL